MKAHENPQTGSRKRATTSGGKTLGVLLLVGLLPLLIVVSVALLAWSTFIHAAIWLLWCSRGQNVLFVSSDSPLWRDHVREHILPRLARQAVILNWSERRRWRPSLARAAFFHFGGDREYNPIGIVFKPFRRTRVFRFWRAFQDAKRGHLEGLQKLESEFFAAASRTRSTTGRP